MASLRARLEAAAGVRGQGGLSAETEAALQALTAEAEAAAAEELKASGGKPGNGIMAMT